MLLNRTTGHSQAEGSAILLLGGAVRFDQEDKYEYLPHWRGMGEKDLRATADEVLPGQGHLIVDIPQDEPAVDLGVVNRVANFLMRVDALRDAFRKEFQVEDGAANRLTTNQGTEVYD
jgi:hypothetical protein